MIQPVILAGGHGSRLWPISRALYPKQFLKLSGEMTMLQATVRRLTKLEATSPLIICNEQHRFIVAEQLSTIKTDSHIILEPDSRDTAPAIALAAKIAQDCADKQEDPLLLVMAADHLIQCESSFLKAVNAAIPFAMQGKLVALGVIPTTAYTGYGYIKRGEYLNGAYEVEQFVEKPNQETAQKYFESGEYYWNSGMFLFKASSYLKELRRYRPDIHESCINASAHTTTDMNFIRVDKEIFRTCPKESVDYAVMEKTDQAVVIPMAAGWQDIGSWTALWDIEEKCRDNNVVKGDVMQFATNNCLVRSEDRLVAVVGLENVIVVDTKDALLVAAKDKCQDVKKIVEQLREENRKEYFTHREVYRPWGKYESVDSGRRYQVKRITVKPGERLSIQKHYHRAEHWIVVSGTAKVTRGNEEFLLTENESVYIPLGTVHALENPGKIPLEIIEVQSGPYLGEDDIVRLQDRYGRA